MKVLKSSLILLGTMGLILLGACSDSSQDNNPASNTETAANTTTPAKIETTNSGNSSKEHNDEDHSHEGNSHEDKEHSHGGQVVESGQYHLEFVTEREADGVHMDLYLEKGEKHETVSNAKVTAQVQPPDGTEKRLDLKYEAEGKHYTALLPQTSAGQYQVKVTADVEGEKVSGRFSIQQ